MKLYYCKGTSSLVTRIIIHELGLQSEYEAVDLHNKITSSGLDFIKINPKGAVPTLITDDNVTLTENSVILQYLADQHHATSLLPEVGDIERYKVLGWLNFLSTDIYKIFVFYLMNEKISAADKSDIYLPLLKSKFAILDKAIANNKYLTGDVFTLPDAYLYVACYWAAYMKIDFSEFSNLTRVYNELNQRQSIIDALAED